MKVTRHLSPGGDIRVRDKLVRVDVVEIPLERVTLEALPQRDPLRDVATVGLLSERWRVKNQKSHRRNCTCRFMNING